MINKLRFLLFLLVFSMGLSHAGGSVEITIEPSAPTEDDEIVFVVIITDHSLLGDFPLFGPNDITTTLDGNLLTIETEYSNCLTCDPPPPFYEFRFSVGQLVAGDYDLNMIFIRDIGSVIELDPFSFTVSRGSIQSVPTLSFFSIFVMMVSFLVLYCFNSNKNRRPNN